MEEEKVVATEEVVAAETVVGQDAPIITVKKLLEAGSQFGHQTKRWNPKMAPYIYMPRNGIYIIDLQKTVTLVENAYRALKDITEKQGKVLFVGTKKQIRDIMIEEATRSGSFYVTQRWLGGTLTNFKTIQKRIKRLKDIEKMEEDGVFANLPKKEVLGIKKEQEKLEKFFSGIKEMRKLPSAVFVIDPRIEHNAVAEAKKLKIPVFGIVDTNSDPDSVDYIIPANDDAVRSVKLITAVMADAVCEAKGGTLSVAYTKDDGEEVSMNEVIKSSDKQAEARRLAKQQKDAADRRNNQRNRRPYDNRRPRPEFKDERPTPVEKPVEVAKEAKKED